MQTRRAAYTNVGRRRLFSCWYIHNSAQRLGLKVPPSARRFPPATGSASSGLLHRGVFTAGLPCPPSRPLVRLAGSVCNGVLPAVDASSPRPPLTRAFSSRAVRRQGTFPVRRLARRGSGTVRGVLAVSVRQQAGRACTTNRNALPAVVLCSPGRVAGRVLASAGGVFSLRLRLAVAGVRLAGVLRQGGSPLITRQRSNGKQRCSPTGCGVSHAQHRVKPTRLRRWVRRRDFCEFRPSGRSGALQTRRAAYAYVSASY